LSNRTKTKKSVHIVLLSDTHELHREVNVPPGDLLIHAGDFTMFSKNPSAISDFNDWLGELPHPSKIVIPGNHEFFLEQDVSRRRLLTNANVLVDEEIAVGGLRIWGSPVTPLYGGAFGRSSARDRRSAFSLIAPGVDILVTHGPPLGVLDQVPGTESRAGCAELAEAVRRVRPKLHVFGHIHGAHGITERDGITSANAALMGLDGDLEAAPIILRMARDW
jgi:predicted phosphohydrolase